MRYELKSIPVWPVTKVAFFVNLAVGFLVGVLSAVLFMPFAAVLTSAVAYESTGLDFSSTPFGALMLMLPFLLAIWSAFFFTVLVVFVVLVYNLTARVVGGLELQLTPTEMVAAVSVSKKPEDSRADESSSRPLPPPAVTSRNGPKPADDSDKDLPSAGATGSEAWRRDDESGTL